MNMGYEEERLSLVDHHTQSVDLSVEPWWEPELEICRWRSEGTRIDIWSDAESFPTEFPDIEAVVCGECGHIYDYESCTVSFSLLCSDCAVNRVWMPEDEEPENWPCSLNERPCDSGYDEPGCAFNILYECIDDVWTAAYDCSEGENCCQSDCEPIE